jgi:meso-butanediol dehydrogenase/(S,S)-butanediol dehydrogenase/diacetyl reductase
LFCAEGGAVVLVDQDELALQKTVGAIKADVGGAQIDSVVCDVSDVDQTARAVAHTVERFGNLNVIVNNAAIRDVASIEQTQPHAWNALIAVNLLGAVNLSKAALRELRADGRASIVNVSSVYGVMARKHWGIYDATKAALISLTRTLACEEAERRIRVKAICVASTLTPYTIARAEVTRGVSPDDLLTEDKDSNLLRRWAQPSEIAYPILWLASDEASFVTGATLMVDGGRSII